MDKMASLGREDDVTASSFDALAEGVGTPPTSALGNELAPGTDEEVEDAEVSTDAADVDRERRLHEVQRVLRLINQGAFQGTYLPEAFGGERPQDDDEGVSDGMVVDYDGVLSGAESALLGWDGGALGSKADVDRDQVIIGLKIEVEKLLAEASSHRAAHARMAAEKDVMESEVAACQEVVMKLQKELGEGNRRQQKLSLDLARLTAALEEQAAMGHGTSKSAEWSGLVDEAQSDVAIQLDSVTGKRIQSGRACEEALAEVRSLRKAIRVQQAEHQVREEEFREKLIRQEEDIQVLLASNQQMAEEKNSHAASEQLAREFAEYCTARWGDEKALREQAEESVAELTEKVEQLQARLVKEQSALQELRRERMTREDEVQKVVLDFKAQMAIVAQSKGREAVQVLRAAADSHEVESMRAEANRWRMEKEKLELDLAVLADEQEEQSIQWNSEKQELMGQVEDANAKLLQLEAQQSKHAGVSIGDDQAGEWGELPLSEEHQRKLMQELKTSRDLLARTENIHAEASANFELVRAYANEVPGAVDRVLLEEVARLRRELASAQAAAEAGQQQLEGARRDRSALEVERHAKMHAEAMCQERGAELARVRGQLAEAERAVASRAADLEGATEAAKMLQEQKGRAEAELSSIAEQLRCLKAEAGRKDEELQRTSTESASWKSRAEEMGRAVDAARAELEDVQAKLESVEEERARLQQELKVEQSERHRTAQQLQESQEEVRTGAEAGRALQEEKAALELRLAEEANSRAAEQAARQEAEKRTADSEQRLSGALTEQAKLASKAEELAEGLATANKCLQAEEATRTRLQRELALAQEALSCSEQESTERIQKLEEELQSSQGRCEELANRAVAAEIKAEEALAKVVESGDAFRKLELVLGGTRSELDGRLEELEGERSKSQALLQELQEVKAALVAAQDESAESKAMRESVCEELRVSQQQLAKTQEAEVSARAGLQAAQEELVSSQQAASTAQASLAKDLDEAKASQGRDQGALATLRERLAKEQAQREVLRQEAEGLQARLRESEQQGRSAEESASRLAAQVSALEQSLASATKAAEGLKAELTSTGDALAVERAKLNGLNLELQEASVALAHARESLEQARAAASVTEALKEALAAAETRGEVQAKQLVEAEEGKQRLEGTVSELQASIAAKAGEADRAAAQVQEFQGLLAQEKQAAETLAAEKESLMAEKDSLTAEKETLTAEKESLTTAKETLAAEKESLTVEKECLLHELAEVQARASAAAAEREQQRAEAEARVKELEASLEALKLEHAEKAGLVEALTGDVTRLESVARAAEQALAEARAEVKAECAKWAAEVQGKEALCGKLQSRTRSLEEELGEAQLVLASELSACAELELAKASLESDSQLLCLRLAEVEAELQQRQRELDQSTAVARELEAECERLRGVIQLQKEAAQRAMEGAQGDAEQMRALLCRLEGELAQSNAAVQAKEAAGAELERANAALTGRLRDQEELLLTEREGSAQALAALQGQLDAAQVEGADLEQRCGTAEESLEAAECALREGEQSLRQQREELGRKEAAWAQASKERDEEGARLRAQLAAAEERASQAQAECSALGKRLDDALKTPASAGKGPRGPGEWVEAERAAAELRGLEARMRREADAQGTQLDALGRQVQQLTGAVEKAQAELAAKQVRLTEAEELARRLQGEVRSQQRGAERATAAASKASKEAEAAKQKQQESERKQRRALEQARREGEQKAAEVEARLRRELSQLASAKDAELQALRSTLAAREKEWAGKDKAWVQAEKQRAAAESEVRKDLEREKREGRAKDAELLRRQEELRKKEGEWAKKIQELSAELGSERKSRGRIRDLESALEAAKKAEKELGAKLQAAEEKASRLKPQASPGAPFLGDLARLEAVINAMEEKAASLEVLVQRKEDENAELRQEMKSIAERMAEEKAGRAAALRKLMSSIPLQADSSSDDGSERQLAGHQFAAHSAGLEEMEARARVLGGMGSPAVAQRALGAGPLVGPRGGGWTVREVVATESNVSSDTDLLSQAPSELGLATPGASGIREHAGGALQAEGDYGNSGWEGQEPAENGHQGGFSANVIFPHELRGPGAAGRRRQKYMVDAIFLDNLRREREDLLMQLAEYRSRSEAFEMICTENTWLQAAVLQLADDNKLLSLKIQDSQRQVASYVDVS